MAWLTTALRRSLLLVLIAAAGGALWSWRRDAADASPPGPAEWPPLPPPTDSTGSEPSTEPDAVSEPVAPTEPAPEAAPSAASFVNALVDAPEARSADGSIGGWAVPLVDGSCPDGYPVKANDNSGIFHLPGGRFYDRTKAERCYSDAAAATRDGYRQAKN